MCTLVLSRPFHLIITGAGAWSAAGALFVGQFVCPLAVLALADAFGGLSSALLAVGVIAVLVALGVRLVRPVSSDGAEGA